MLVSATVISAVHTGFPFLIAGLMTILSQFILCHQISYIYRLLSQTRLRKIRFKASP